MLPCSYFERGLAVFYKLYNDILLVSHPSISTVHQYFFNPRILLSYLSLAYSDSGPLIKIVYFLVYINLLLVVGNWDILETLEISRFTGFSFN